MTDITTHDDSARDVSVDDADASVFALLRSSTRFWVLSTVTLVSAASVAGREIARLKFATEALGDASGIGIIGVVFAVTLGASGLVFGRVVDVRNPRRLYVGSLLFSAVLAAFNVWVLAQGTMPLWWMIVTTALEGVYFGIAGPAYLKIQAALVGPSAKGAAEIVSILRLGVGAIIGTLLAGLSDRPGPILAGCAVAAAVSALAVELVVRSVPFSAERTEMAPLAVIRSRLRDVPWIRPTIVADLVLAFVLPTQFVALVIIDRSLESVTTTAFVSSLSGVLAGRLLLTVIGLRGDLRRAVLLPYVLFLVLTAVGAAAMIDDWIFDRPIVIAVGLFLGSAAMTYAQSATAALIQQQVPEEIRGAVSGAMNGGRNALMAISGGIVAAIAVATSAMGITVALTIGLVVGLVVTGGFRGVRLRD